MPFAALRVAHLRRERAQLRQRLDAEVAQPAQQRVQDVDGGACVGQRPMYRLGRGAEERGQRCQPAIRNLVASQDPTGEDRRVDHRETGPAQATFLAGHPKKPHVERGIVRDKHTACGELEERREYYRDRGSAADHRVGDTGEHAHERSDPDARVDQRLKLADHLSAANLDGADLGDPVVARPAASRLQVDDRERRVAQRLVELVQAHLLKPTTRWSGGHGRAGHVRDVRREV